MADVGLVEQALTPSLLNVRLPPLLAGAPVLMLDGNLSAAAIEVSLVAAPWLTLVAGWHVFCTCVSHSTDGRPYNRRLSAIPSRRL